MKAKEKNYSYDRHSLRKSKSASDIKVPQGLLFTVKERKRWGLVRVTVVRSTLTNSNNYDLDTVRDSVDGLKQTPTPWSQVPKFSFTSSED